MRPVNRSLAAGVHRIERDAGVEVDFHAVIDLGASWSRWALPVVVTLVLVGLTALPQVGAAPLVPVVDALLIAAAVGWYWSLETRVQPEAVPKLRLGAFAVLVLLLALLYGLLVRAISLPSTLRDFLLASLLGVAGAAMMVTLAAAADVALLARQRWGRILVAVLTVGLALTVGLRATRAPEAADGGWLDPVGNPWPLVLGVVLLALTAPMEWVVALDRQQRLAVLAGWVAALAPLAMGIYVERMLGGPDREVLLEAVRIGAILAVAFLGMLLARATLALPGARAYERKVRELDAVYAFGLTARTAFNPQELQAAVVDSMLRVAEPDVAMTVEPDPDGSGVLCVLVRADNQGQHMYRFRVRDPWARLAERFADRRPVVITDHRKAPAGALANIWEPSTGSSVVVPVVSQQGEPRAVLIAGRFERHAFNAAEVRSLTGFASQVALAFDHAGLLREVVESERRKRELEIARELQINLLPSAPPRRRGLDIADRSDPATEVGGDYFDYLSLADGRLGVVVGDVAGHGMPAGLLMAMAKSAIHTQVQAGISPSELMERLDETLLGMSADNQFMTMVFAELDVEGGFFRYANAGHHYPLHYRASTGSFHELESTGLPLGMLPRPPGPFRECPLAAGDLLVFYSDGLVEACRDEEGEDQFTMSRLRRTILAHRGQSANTVVDEVYKAVRRFCGDRPLHDDATLVIVRVLDAESEPPTDGGVS